MERGPAMAERNETGTEAVGQKRQQPQSDIRYPRKRSLRACHVCRARKTKCDNAQPKCGFCASINIACSYDASEKDHSAFDPASLEILRQLGQVIRSQEDLLQIARSVAASQSQYAAPHLSPSAAAQVPSNLHDIESQTWVSSSRDIQATTQFPYVAHDWQQQESASTSPSASAGVAAVRWFDLLANDASRDALPEADVTVGVEGGFLDALGNQDEHDMTPLQRATRLIDKDSTQDLPDHTFTPGTTASNLVEEGMWQASANITLLDREQVLFEHFLNRICSWLDQFDPGRTFSTRVPHLAVRNAGLLNAILALSSYHQAAGAALTNNEHPDQNTALQYYYQTLHYVQKAMRYATYQNSQELMATTLIVSTYEMLRGSRKDWQQHLQGVFWILRSRQIEVEAPSLESTTWWAWLGQNIWVAFREKSRTYSTWRPKKAVTELTSHELASRALWILAQVVNYCAIEPTEGDAARIFAEKVAGAETLWNMLNEWKAHLTVEFSLLPAMSRNRDEVFQPRLIHPPCFGLAMQIHHVSRILLSTHEPCVGGLESFMKRQRTLQTSIDMICGLGMTLTEDASSMLSSQCLFIAGLFMQNARQKQSVLEMLDACRKRCGWPTPSLGSELKQIWEGSKTT